MIVSLLLAPALAAPLPLPVAGELVPMSRCRGSTAGGFSVEGLRGELSTCQGFHVLHPEDRTIKAGVEANLGGGRLLVSADGERVVFIADKPSTSDAPVVWFWRGEELVASWNLHTLTARPDAEAAELLPTIASLNDTSAGLPDVLVITTSNYRQATIDTRTGALRSVKDSPAWTACDAIVMGEARARTGQLMMREGRMLKGEATLPLTFGTTPPPPRTAFLTICLPADGGDPTVMHGISDPDRWMQAKPTLKREEPRRPKRVERRPR